MVAPIDIFDSIFKQIHFYQKCVGTDGLTKGFVPHKWTWFFFGLDFSFVVFNCYTLSVYDTTVRLKCMAIFGLGLQGFSKFPTIIYHAATLYDTVAFLRTIYARIHLSVHPAYAILEQFSRLIRVVMRVGSVLIILCAMLYVPESFVESWLAGHRVPMLNTMVPGVQIAGEGHWPEYMAIYAYHFILVFLGGFGTCAVDMLLVMLVMHSVPLALIFEKLLDDLNNAVSRVDTHSNIEFGLMFRNILLVHKEFTMYIESIASIYYYVFLMEINTDALSLCVLIVCSMQISWIGIYPLAVLFLFKLFAYCFLGTIAELTTDRVYAALLRSRWHEMGGKQQREFILMLLVAQRPAVLMAGTVPLNLDTFVNMLKTVYSAGMLLMESVN